MFHTPYSTVLIQSPTYGDFRFDAVFSAEHTSNVTVTSHPIQSGASVSDHAYTEPDEVSLEIGMTDAAENAADGHSVNAYTQLRAMQEKREPLTLITRLRQYANMVITSISAPDDVTTMHALRASVHFQEARIVSVATVQVQQTVSASKAVSSGSSAVKPKAQPAPANQPQTEDKNQSVLYKLYENRAKTATPVTTTKTPTPATKPVLKTMTLLTE